MAARERSGGTDGVAARERRRRTDREAARDTSPTRSGRIAERVLPAVELRSIRAVAHVRDTAFHGPALDVRAEHLGVADVVGLEALRPARGHGVVRRGRMRRSGAVGRHSGPMWRRCSPVGRHSCAMGRCAGANGSRSGADRWDDHRRRRRHLRRVRRGAWDRSAGVNARASRDHSVVAKAVLPCIILSSSVSIAALSDTVADNSAHVRSAESRRRVDVGLRKALAPAWRVRHASSRLREASRRESRSPAGWVNDHG